MKRISIASLVTVLGCAWVASQAMAQQGGAAQPQSLEDVSARLQQQDQQIQQLQAQLSSMQQQGATTTPAAYAPPGAAPAAPADPPAPAEVGSDMSLKARFYNGAGLMFESPNKDFTLHAGFWAQWDNVSWNQNALNNAKTTGNIGYLNDGDYWRRIRPFVEGTFFETCEYRFNLALENDQFSTTGLDEFFIGIHSLPVLGTVRVGHVKNCIGLEGDMASSSRCMTFMERSSYSQAIELNQNFVNGLWFGNTACDDRFFYSGVVFHPDDGSSGDFMGTGQYGWQARITGLPIYQDEGRELLHLGLSGGWRNGTNAIKGGGPGTPNVVSLGAGPEMKDDDPAGSPGFISGGTAQYLPYANSPKLVNTGNIYCDQEWLLGTELLYIRGPFSFQAEYGWNFLNNAQLTLTSGQPSGPVENYVFNGGYLQVSYMLTGENRAYDKKFATLSRYYLGSQGPYENAFLVRDADGGFCAGHGAVELACRYSYTDLNSGLGTTAAHTYVNGGEMQGVGLALNWYLNTNLTIMTDWNYDYRYNDGANAPGSTNGLGSEVQLSF